MTIVTISDTHGHHNELTNLPSGDIIIHSGDFTPYNKTSDEPYSGFISWFSKTPYKYKILIAGNHDREVEKLGYHKFYNLCNKFGIIYLEDSSVTIEGVKFYGSPWTPVFKNWSFMKTDHKLKDVWKKIDDNTDILITHGPAYEILDRNKFGQHIGSPSLSQRIKELSLKYHIFGHCHEDFGMKEYGEAYISVNASCLNKSSFSVNKFIPSFIL